MTFGASFSNLNSYRVLETSTAMDGTRIIPQLLGHHLMSSYSYTDDTVDSQPGYTLRTYSFSASATYSGRKTLSFVTLPTNGQAVFVDSTGTQVLFASGTSFSAPEVYVFALDYVSQGNDTWGGRFWNESGALQYDSGNIHLALDQILTVNVDMTFSQTDYPDAAIQSYSAPNGSFPAKAAAALPIVEYGKDYGTRFVADTQIEAYAFYRIRNGNTLDTALMRTTHYVDSSTGGSVYTHVYQYRSTNLPVLVIDASLCD